MYAAWPLACIGKMFLLTLLRVAMSSCFCRSCLGCCVLYPRCWRTGDCQRNNGYDEFVCLYELSRLSASARTRIRQPTGEEQKPS